MHVAPPVAVAEYPLCRIQRTADLGWYDTKLSVACTVGKLNGKTACIPEGMWEAVGSAFATPQCDRLFDWSRNDKTSCLYGHSNFTILTVPHAAQPQVCGDLHGVIYQIAPTDYTLQYDDAAGCTPFPNFVLDLSVSRYSEFVPYPPRYFTEADFVDPLAETNCRRP